jgi:hypothetical protein
MKGVKGNTSFLASWMVCMNLSVCLRFHQVVAAGPNDMRMYYHSFDARRQKYVVGLAVSPDGFRCVDGQTGRPAGRQAGAWADKLDPQLHMMQGKDWWVRCIGRTQGLWWRRKRSVGSWLFVTAAVLEARPHQAPTRQMRALGHVMELRTLGLGFRVQGIGFNVQGSGLRQVGEAGPDLRGLRRRRVGL